MRRVTPQPSFGHDLSASLLDRFREYSVALNQCADHRLSEFVSVTGTYTAGENDHVIECAPSGAMTVTLPAASVMRNKRIVIKRTNNTTHTVTIQSSSGNIDGAASVTLTTAHQSREVFSDGANWWLLDTGATAPTDPYFANVQLLLHFDGTNGSTSFIDSSSAARTVSVYSGSPVLTTSNLKFGSAGGSFPGSSAAITAGTGLDFTGDFTIDCWLRYSNETTVGQVLWSMSGGTSTTYFYCVKTNNGTNSGIGVACMNMTTVNTLTYPMTAGNWYHISFVRSGSTGYVFIDGVLIQSNAVSTDVPATSREFLIGDNTTVGNELVGQIDDLRVTIGTARYTADFDVPTEAYPDA